MFSISRLLTVSLLIFISQDLHAQTNWQLLSPDKNNRYGAAVEQAYSLLKNKTPKQITVALIDIGTDINHPDLKDIIWTNPNEIPGNGIDDDHNGYVDDIHGWNFLGGKNGSIEYEAVEATRVFQGERRKIAKMDTTALVDKNTPEFARYKKLEKEYNKAQRERVSDSSATVRAWEMNKSGFWHLIFKMLIGGDVTEQLAMAKDMAVKQAIYNRLDVDSIRRSVIGDDPENVHERYYGNNDVIGPEASHGTHTAGILAAIRNNNIGINGVTNNIRLMVLRAVPWGDERDKDIANAIRYAADNGASVISMSFGKYTSPDKAVVDSAIAYAVSKDVLIVHASGNENKNTDTTDCFPNPRSADKSDLAGSWIEVGANARKGNKKLTASFSNYGARTVDLFAPGVDIYSTMPGNKYGNESGTSMAAPVVAGVAALIRSYFPQLNAKQVKEVLMKTVTPYYGPVRVPGAPKHTYAQLKDLCVSGGIVNAEKAVSELMKN